MLYERLYNTLLTFYIMNIPIKEKGERFLMSSHLVGGLKKEHATDE